MPPEIRVNKEKFLKEFNRLCPYPEKFVLAISGGADSMVLLWLASHVKNVKKRGFVLSVDHGLRKEAKAETALVRSCAKKYGLPYQTLYWKPAKKPKSDIQAQARGARYGLMQGWMGRRKIKYLVTAHHLEDQAETFLLRLARGSGVDGLSAMARSRLQGGVHLIRPLLGFSSVNFRKILIKNKLQWVEDSSNENVNFARVRMRKLMPLLAEEGMDALLLAKTANAMGRARLALEQKTAELWQCYMSAPAMGILCFDPEGLLCESDEIALRLLANAIAQIAGGIYRPRLASLQRLLGAMRKSQVKSEVKGMTLGGCQIAPFRGKWLFFPEMAHIVSQNLNASQPAFFTPTLEIRLPARQKPVKLAPLGRQGMAYLRKKQHEMPPLPAATLHSLPALWRKNTLFSCPSLHFGQKCSIKWHQNDKNYPQALVF